MLIAEMQRQILFAVLPAYTCITQPVREASVVTTAFNDATPKRDLVGKIAWSHRWKLSKYADRFAEETLGHTEVEFLCIRKQFPGRRTSDAVAPLYGNIHRVHYMDATTLSTLVNQFAV